MPDSAPHTATRSGIALDELDPDIRPQDDLFRHVNGRWIARTQIPADRARYGSFLILTEEAQKAIRAIIEEAQGAEPGSEARKVGDLYASFMDTAAIEARGAEPLAAGLAAARAVDSIPGLLRTIGRLEADGIGGFLQLFVDNDPGAPERYVVFAEQDGIGLPDESYYREESFQKVREAYRGHIERMFTLAGLGDAAARAARVFELEKAIAHAHWDNVRSRDSEATYNLRSWAQVRALAGGAEDSGQVDGVGPAESALVEASPDLDQWRDALGAPPASLDEIVVRQPSFLHELAGLFTADRLDAWRDWLAWQVIHAHAPYLSQAFVDENFDFYGRTLSGTPQLRERWKRGVSLVEGALGEAAGRVYVERHFPPAAKASMDSLVANLIEAYRQSIGGLAWMGAKTRARALEKLDKFTPKIGYPTKWRDYSSLEIDAGDLIANVRATSRFEFRRELGKIGRPIDRDEWFMTPQTVNAYYNPGFNEIVFPAAILQYPFFDPDRDDAANYGAIGAVIGHEIGHGFDDQGAKYDGDGRLVNWWTPDDQAAFEARTASLVAQYNELSPRQVPDHHVNGALTIGENIGDLGGLAIAWRAYLLSLDGAEPEVIDGMTGAERFFLSWAQSWQQKGRDEEVIRLLAIDPHSPDEFR
ncbi:MAG TPA: M13-type metalloendopeptidase, partial [Microbacteriaceae bacterium]|nr:M13-type metalloendopeptidase [Microbacteriaceae bacterium]